MNSLLQYSGNYFDKHFNAKSVRSVELLILRVAVFAFLFHLIIIFLGNNFIYFKNTTAQRALYLVNLSLYGSAICLEVARWY